MRDDGHARLSSLAALLATLAFHAALIGAFVWTAAPGDGAAEKRVGTVRFVETTRIVPAATPPRDAHAEPPQPRPRPPRRVVATPPPLAAVATDRPSASPPASEPIAGGETDDAILRRYAALIWQEIAAHKPSGLGRRGTAHVTFSLDASGRVRSLTLARSSGDAMLDARAMAAVRFAAPFAPPPAALAPADLVFTVPLEFR